MHPDGRSTDPGASKRRKEFTDGQTAKVIDALKGVLDHGTAAGMGIGCPAAGKTGTTSSFTDAWFIGYHADACRPRSGSATRRRRRR